jgi:hypothetical protein
MTRRRWATAAYALGASGCSLIFGLHDNQGPVGDAGLDVPSQDVAGADVGREDAVSRDTAAEDMVSGDAVGDVLGAKDVAEASAPPEQPPNVPCGAGDDALADNGMCGPDGRVYYCLKGTWYLKADCVKEGVGCVVEPPGVADECATACPHCGVGQTCDAGVCP